MKYTILAIPLAHVLGLASASVTFTYSNLKLTDASCNYYGTTQGQEYFVIYSVTVSHYCKDCVPCRRSDSIQTPKGGKLHASIPDPLNQAKSLSAYDGNYGGMFFTADFTGQVSVCVENSYNEEPMTATVEIVRPLLIFAC